MSRGCSFHLALELELSVTFLVRTRTFEPFNCDDIRSGTGSDESGPLVFTLPATLKEPYRKLRVASLFKRS